MMEIIARRRKAVIVVASDAVVGIVDSGISDVRSW